METWFWFLLIVAAVFVAGAIWLWLRSRAGRPSASLPPGRTPDTSGLISSASPKALPAPAVPEADDLAAIEGIGPRIHDVLHDAGITSFAQLANTRVARLEQILEAADLPPANPESWPAQARLAAESRWAELHKLQESLRGGVAPKAQ